MLKPHLLAIDDLIKQLKSHKDTGLSEADARARLIQYGANELQHISPTPWIIIFLRQFQNPLIYVLLAAAGIIFFTSSDPLDAFIISGVLLFNAIIGTIQEGRARSILQSLQQLLVTQTIVIRDGTKKLIETSLLVPGDLIVLQAGSRIPADARIIREHTLQVDESMLTGESEPIMKNAAPLVDDVSLADQKNMLFKGTYILSGSGIAIITATGKNTEIGKLSTVVQAINTDMPLKHELTALSHKILIFTLMLCLTLLVVGFMLQHRPVSELLIMLTALFVCIVPEGLTVVLTLVLASGTNRMAKHNVLVKNMQAVEGLGRTDVIVTDKTGTLTRNEMVVSRVFAGDQFYSISGHGYHARGQIFANNQKIEPNTINHTMRMFGIASSLLNEAEITYSPSHDLFTIKGDPTEAALFVLSQKLAIVDTQLQQEYRLLYELSFNPLRQYHAAFFEHQGTGVAFIAGSPEVIISRSLKAHGAQQALAQLLDTGLRVIACAMKTFDLTRACLDESAYEHIVKTDLTFLGLCGIQDTIRPEITELVEQTRNAGIQIIMATGDHEKTALYVARNVGIFHEGDYMLEGKELEHITDKQTLEMLPKVTVFARVSPLHKLKIIELLHKEGKIVAMTGDGINDAPSLAAADLGIAMGLIGTEVAKDASDIILLDDSFSNIIRAIELGRHIFASIKRVVLYFFATNLGEVFVVLFAFIFNMSLPLTAAQILWVNLVTDGFLTVALSAEPQEPALLNRTWIHRNMHLIDGRMLARAFYMAFIMGAISLVLFWYYQSNLALARTITFVAMVLFQWFNALNCRSENRSLFQIGLFSNHWLTAAMALVFGLQIAVVNTALGHHIFKTISLTFGQWFLIIGLASSLLFVEEIRKLIVRRWLNN